MLKVHLVTFILASCSIMYELLLATMVSSLTGSAVAWYSLTIGLFLVSMGMGSFLIIRREQRSAFTSLVWVELALSLIGGVAPVLLSFSHLTSSFLLIQNSNPLGPLVLIGSAIVLICVLGFLSGLELPLLLTWGTSLGSSTNKVLALDYFGSLVGAVSLALFVVPNFGNFQAAALIGSVNLLTALYLLFVFRSQINKKIHGFLALATCLVLSLVSANISSVEQFFLQRYYYYELVSERFVDLFKPLGSPGLVERYRSRYQTIDIVKMIPRDGDTLLSKAYSTKLLRKDDFPVDYALFINGTPQVFSNFEEVYHEYFAHVPVYTAKLNPEKVLILGGGDGMLLREVLKYQTLESVTLVDFDSTMIDLAKTHPVLSAINEASLHNPKVNIVIDDAFRFVRQSDQTYDAIYLDFPFADNYNVSRVYSFEFYSKLKKLLRPAGFVAMIANGINYLGLPDDFGKQEVFSYNLWPSYYSSIKAAGFDNVVPYFSNYERFTPSAYKAVLDGNLIDFPPDVSFDEKAVMINLYLRNYILNSQVGFIMMYQGSRERKTYFEPQAIQLDVLNQVRFQSALRPILTEPDKVDPELVNSIMKPTLTNFYPFKMKLPYAVSY